MIGRREALIGLGCVAAAGGAAAMTPRRHGSLLGGAPLDAIVPKAFAGWSELPAEGILTPPGDDSLAAKLYNQTVARAYADADGNRVALLIAYGNTQSDQLQLHRPEVCYPAFGYNVSGLERTMLALPHAEALPAKRLRAETAERGESLTYWTRIGEEFPTDAREQRVVKWRAAWAGLIPDGVLVRLSNALEGEDAFALNARFAAALAAALDPRHAAALIGTRRAQEIARSRA